MATRRKNEADRRKWVLRQVSRSLIIGQRDFVGIERQEIKIQAQPIRTKCAYKRGESQENGESVQ